MDKDNSHDTELSIKDIESLNKRLLLINEALEKTMTARSEQDDED